MTSLAQHPTAAQTSQQSGHSSPEAKPRSQTVLLAVSNMHCSSCVKKIQTALRPFGPDVSMQAEPTTRTLSLTWTQAPPASQNAGNSPTGQGLSLSQLIAAISAAGFPAQLVNISESADTPAPNWQRIAVALLFTMQTMMLALAGYLGADQGDALIKAVMDHAQWAVATPVVFYSGWPFLYGAWRDISSRQVTMDLPVGIAIFSAYTFSAFNVLRGDGVIWFDSATMFVSLLLIARQLENSGRARATKQLHKLFSQQKNLARRLLADNSSEQVATSLIAVDDLVEVFPAESLPVDGIALSKAVVSEAVLTGEATPKTKAIGDELFAGSILISDQPLKIRTTASGQNTSLGRITQLMHQALTDRPAVQQLADKVASYFVLTVLVLAAGGGIVWSFWNVETGLTVALTVLVASCPCALSLATPSALAASVSRLARQGIMILKLDGLMNSKTVDHIIFDKTGTLTSDELQIEAIQIREGLDGEGLDKDQALSIAAGLETISNHPIASAFSNVTAIKIENPSVKPTSVIGVYNGESYVLRTSSAAELAEFGIKDSAGTIYLSLCKRETTQAVISLSAPLRHEALATITELKARGIKVALYSGDKAENVAAIALQLGIDKYAGGLTPADKLTQIRALQQREHCVAAVGDGVNDAPLLAAADIGIAMGSGTAQAQSGASIVLRNNNLLSISNILDESKTLHNRITQNISWAVAYNATVFPLALSGLLAPWVAAIGMASSSILVVSNAMRDGKRPSPTRPSNGSASMPASAIKGEIR